MTYTVLYLLCIIFLSGISLSRGYDCDPFNKTTYLIPSANFCFNEYDIGGDHYYFGPINTLNAIYLLYKCKFAVGREFYCLEQDKHFCALVDKGFFINYYMVECG